MNILHLDEQRGWRGGEQQASYLIKGLMRRGHRVFLAGRPNAPFVTRHAEPDGATTFALPFLSELDLWSAWKVARIVNRNNIQIVHAHTSHTHTTACLARLLGAKAKIVVSRRVDFRPKGGIINRWKYAAPDCIVAISNRIAQVLREFMGSDSRITVVHSAIDAKRLEADPLPRSELGVAEGAPLLGNVAALVGHKDHATLIAAMPAVLEKLPDLRLVIAGEGDLRPAIEKQIQELGLEQSVTLLGHRDDVPRLLRALDAFVLSSKYEGLGTSILDAMACRVPVVATDGGGIPEMVHHEKTGLLAPAQNPEALARAIVRLFREPALTAAMTENAKALVHDSFDVDTMVEGNVRVYAGLL